MLYTIGHTQTYEESFQSGSPNKVGRRDDYDGGCIVKTREEAQSECPDDYSVYGVDADWDEHTYWCERLSLATGGYRALLADRPLIKLKEPSGE